MFVGMAVLGRLRNGGLGWFAAGPLCAKVRGKLPNEPFGGIMKTDWNLIREMMSAAIDTCERIETCGYSENDRDASAVLSGQHVSVYEMLVSAWTYPENIRYQIIRSRHDNQNDLPYVPESARILIAMAQASAELIDANVSAKTETDIRRMIDWFRNKAAPKVEEAISNKRVI